MSVFLYSIERELESGELDCGMEKNVVLIVKSDT